MLTHAEALSRMYAAESRVRDLESFRGDVMAGCDIQRGDRLYRQVEVVIGPGQTRDRMRVVELERRMDECCPDRPRERDRKGSA